MLQLTEKFGFSTYQNLGKFQHKRLKPKKC